MDIKKKYNSSLQEKSNIEKKESNIQKYVS